MGYKDNFYTKDNILGYTGFLDEDSTVYFSDCGSVNQKWEAFESRRRFVVQYGHITQAYDDNENIGREEVRDCATYSIHNVLDEYGKKRCRECISGTELDPQSDLMPDADGHFTFHESRSSFVGKNDGNVEILAIAIERYPFVKLKYKNLYSIRFCSRAIKPTNTHMMNRKGDRSKWDEYYDWDEWDESESD